MSVLVYKFNSGEEVIAESTATLSTGTWVISKPLRIVVRPTPDGHFAPAFTPWIAAYDGRSLEVSDRSLLVPPFAAPAQFEQAYLEETSGIAVVTNTGSIVTS